MKFNVAMTCGYDSSSDEFSCWGVEINDDKYSKDVYVELDRLICEYYFIKYEQKFYKNKTKKERLETQKRLVEDKKRLTSIANHIVYGYSDLFLEYYNWCRPLCRHYIDQCKKNVEVGPSLIKVKKIERTIYED